MLSYMLIGGKHIHCRNCGTQLVLKSLGKRFWQILSGGLVLSVAEWLYFSSLRSSLSETGSSLLFASTLILTFVWSLGVGWRDASVERR